MHCSITNGNGKHCDGNGIIGLNTFIRDEDSSNSKNNSIDRVKTIIINQEECKIISTIKNINGVGYSGYFENKERSKFGSDDNTHHQDIHNKITTFVVEIIGVKNYNDMVEIITRISTIFVYTTIN